MVVHLDGVRAGRTGGLDLSDGRVEGATGQGSDLPSHARMADAVTPIAGHLDLLLNIAVLEGLASFERESAGSQGVGLLLRGCGGREIVVEPFDTGFHRAVTVSGQRPFVNGHEPLPPNESRGW